MFRPEPSQKLSNLPSPEASARKRSISERKIQANRRNALRSTGPKTERGKCTVALNAIKHGLLAREVVITAGDGKESLERFHGLIEDTCKCYEPVGAVEEWLVQTIATCYWRKARVIRAENGEIRKRLDTLASDRALRNSDNANLSVLLSETDLSLFRRENQADQQVSSMDRWYALQTAQTDLRKHESSLAYLKALLGIAKSEIASNGHLPEKIRWQIFSAFCFWDCLFALTCLNAGPTEAKMEDPSADKMGDQKIDEKRAFVGAFIDQRLEDLKSLGVCAPKREELVADAEARSLSLPPADAANKLLRYEAHLDRQLYRAMDQLERLQRRRSGEVVPPPLNINLGRKS